MYRRFAALLAAASLASAAGAQVGTSPGPLPVNPPVGAPSLTLAGALALGGVGDANPVPPRAGNAASPSVAAATAGVDAARAARQVAGLRPNPEIQSQIENIGGSGPYRGVMSAETTVGVALPLELGGKRPARVALARARLSRAEIQAQIARADLRLRITQLYVEAAAAARRAQVLGEQAKIAADSARLAGDRVDIGDVGPIERQRADVLRINAQIAADNAIREAEAARLNLATLLGAAVSGPFDLAWFDRVGTVGPLQAIDVDSTLALAAAEADVSAATAQVRVARSLRVPDVTITASARRLESTNDTAAVFGLNIPIPIFNNGKAFVAQSRSEETQAVALRNVAVIDTRQAIARAQTDVANAAATARAAGGPGLTAAQEAARIARIGWAQGKFDQIALLDAERTLSQTRQAYVDALAAYHDAEARLDRLTTPAQPVSGDMQ